MSEVEWEETHFPNRKLTSQERDIWIHVLIERRNQDKKFGIQNHEIHKWLSILGEEVGECHKAALEDNKTELREELIQVAAVSQAIIESMDRNK
jgi:NTP pyrophosphatase (non-canonical NTP hydrolase)